MWLNRTMCDVLEEMRKLTQNVSGYTVDEYRKTMAYLIEEVQSMGNRMEAGLGDKRDLNELREKKAKLKKEVKELKEEIKVLKEELGKENEEEKLDLDSILNGDD